MGTYLLIAKGSSFQSISHKGGLPRQCGTVTVTTIKLHQKTKVQKHFLKNSHASSVYSELDYSVSPAGTHTPLRLLEFLPGLWVSLKRKPKQEFQAKQRQTE